MATTTKKKAAKTPVRKLLLASPFMPTWPTLEDGREETLLKTFLALKQVWAPSGVRETHLIVGLNAVTRALERRQVSGVLFNVAANPPKLIHGVIQLCYSTETPVACVERMDRFVAGLTDAHSTLALAFRRSDDPSPSIAAFVGELASSVSNRPKAVIPKKEQPRKTAMERKNVAKPRSLDVSAVYLPRKIGKVEKLADHIALVGENALGFPSYDPPVEVVVRSDVVQAKKTEERPSKLASEPSSYVKSNVKRVFSSGKRRNGKTSGPSSTCHSGK